MFYSHLAGLGLDLRIADAPEGQGSAVHLIGVEFSRTARNVVGFEVETITG